MSGTSKTACAVAVKDVLFGVLNALERGIRRIVDIRCIVPPPSKLEALFGIKSYQVICSSTTK
jgi:hypothetical protein